MSGLIIKMIKDKNFETLGGIIFVLAMPAVIAGAMGMAWSDNSQDILIWPLFTLWFCIKWLASFLIGFDLYIFCWKWLKPLAYMLFLFFTITLFSLGINFLFGNFPNINNAELGWVIIVSTFMAGFLCSYNWAEHP